MKKDIKDYLHLYLLSEISVFVFPDESITDGFLDRYKVNYPNGVYAPVLTIDNYKKFLRDGYKPILRPLSDMTEEEAKVLDDMARKQKDGQIPPPHCEFVTGIRTQTAEALVYMLSKGFDLFNLIPEGLAIDKTTIK